jgi:endonuclease/exonuclease/phosphatase family metal-dependent hydrolase
MFARSRRRQMDALAGYLEGIVDPDSPLIIAGDFNDWRNEADELLAHRLDMIEAFGGAFGGVNSPGRSFPSKRPLLRLDRIYVRGFTVELAEMHSGAPWSKISDHAALSAHLEWTCEELSTSRRGMLSQAEAADLLLDGPRRSGWQPIGSERTLPLL